ncbi:MAG: hypothetical protein HKN31_12920, partial [Pricia sp.]|nr:hypothetical protein [Pricia sp.]
GYTQGIGLSYEVDFNSFRALFRSILQKEKEKPKEDLPDPAKVPSAVMGKDSLLRFYPKTNGLR